MNQNQDAEKKIRMQFEQVLKNLDYFNKAIRHFLAEQKVKKVNVPVRPDSTNTPEPEIQTAAPVQKAQKTLQEALIENARLKQENETLKKMVSSLRSKIEIH